MQREDFPLVSIITLNWNNTALTIPFLESSRKLTYPNYEILVCDMGSTEDPTEIINAGNYPNTRVLRHPENLGFAAGNNFGMRNAKGSYMFIVNNDTELSSGILEALLEPFKTNPHIGAVSPKIRYFYHPDTIQYAGFNPMNKLTGRTSSIGRMEIDKGQHDIARETAGAHGCAMMVPREVLDQTGMFPEVFFLQYEEWDWSARMQKAGYKIWYQPKAWLLHKEGATVSNTSAIKVYYHYRSRILYMRRNAGNLNLVAFALFFSFFSVPKAVAGYLFRGKFTHLKQFLRACSWNLTHSSRSVIR